MGFSHRLDIRDGVLVAPQSHIHNILLPMVLPQLGILANLERKIYLLRGVETSIDIEVIIFVVTRV